MRAKCPKCHSYNVRIHGTTSHLSFVPKWRFFGRPTLKAVAVSAECSCGECYYAFVLTPDGITPAPRQDAYDQLKGAAEATRIAINRTDKREEKKTEPNPRPAGDPRVKRR